MDKTNRVSTGKKSRGKQCSVYGCFNFAFLQNGIPSGLHFFRIHKAVLADKKQKDRWCTLIKRRDGMDGFSMNSNTVICQDHFKKDDISISMVTKKWTLKQDVEPSVFTLSDQLLTRKSPKKRLPFASPFKGEDFSDSGYMYTCVPLDLHEQAYNTNDNDVSQSCHYKDLPNTIATQTEWPTHRDECSSKEGIACSTEHNYSFSMDDFLDQERHTDSLKKQIEKLTLKMQIASQNIADLQEQIEYYEGKRFTLDKIKDDNDAISFYTGFQNYGVFNSVFNYLEVKASRLQYWRGQSDTNSDFKQYQTRGKRPGPKRKPTLVEEFFYGTHEAESWTFCSRPF